VEQGPEDFRVKITKLRAIDPAALAPSAPPKAAGGCGTAQAPAKASDIQEIDARGLEPPQPLIRILDALEALPAGMKLQAQTDREPCHLFGEAEQRGFNADCRQKADGSWTTLLTRR
jgi:uncharacterized protein (DUF2249 family)